MAVIANVSIMRTLFTSPRINDGGTSGTKTPVQVDPLIMCDGLTWRGFSRTTENVGPG